MSVVASRWSPRFLLPAGTQQQRSMEAMLFYFALNRGRKTEERIRAPGLSLCASAHLRCPNPTAMWPLACCCCLLPWLGPWDNALCPGRTTDKPRRLLFFVSDPTPHITITPAQRFRAQCINMACPHRILHSHALHQGRLTSYRLGRLYCPHKPIPSKRCLVQGKVHVRHWYVCDTKWDRPAQNQ